MFLKTALILLAFISVVYSQTDDEESFLFVTKQTVNRFIVQGKELTIKYGLYNSGPTYEELTFRFHERHCFILELFSMLI